MLLVSGTELELAGFLERVLGLGSPWRIRTSCQGQSTQSLSGFPGVCLGVSFETGSKPAVETEL